MVSTFPSSHRNPWSGRWRRFRRSRPELVEKFNAAIKAIRTNGKYKGDGRQCFDFDAYGAEKLIQN